MIFRTIVIRLVCFLMLSLLLLTDKCIILLGLSKAAALVFRKVQAEVESRTQRWRSRPRTQKRSEVKAKDRLFEDILF